MSAVLLTACGPNKIVADLPSPDGKYHVEVRLCPQPGSLTWTEKTQVSVLPGRHRKCQGSLQAVAQFDSYGPQDQLQVEWIATEVRAWHPQFNPEYGPQSANYKPDNPIKLIFAQALGGLHSVFLWTLPSFRDQAQVLVGIRQEIEIG